MTTVKRDTAERIVRATLGLGRRLRAERPRGSASLSALGILSTLNRLGPMLATRLAAEERLQPQSLTRIIVGLERSGWITRARNPADRREISIALTRRGRGILDVELRARRIWLERAMAAVLTAKERAALLEATASMLKLAGHRHALDRG